MLFQETKRVQILCKAILTVGERRQSPAHCMVFSPSQPCAHHLENRVEPVGEVWHDRGVPRWHVLVAPPLAADAY